MPDAPLVPSTIDFTSLSFEGALHAALWKRQFVFVEAYKNDCPDCRTLHQQAYGDTTVGYLYNKYFISIKVDVETPQGRIIAKRYEINDYPTLLYLSDEGYILQRVVGAKTAEEMINLNKSAIHRFGAYHNIPEPETDI